MLPSSMTGTRTPYEIFTHQKPTLAAYTSIYLWYYWFLLPQTSGSKIRAC
jgi:hypothetical protein